MFPEDTSCSVTAFQSRAQSEENGINFNSYYWRKQHGHTINTKRATSRKSYNRARHDNPPDSSLMGLLYDVDVSIDNTL
jgi:hypothetical protein